MLKKFLIEHLDPMAQGVSKLDSKVLFIPKVLPGESGICKVTYQKSKIQFGEVDSFSAQSEQRVEPQCPHYNICSGCHFLHTNRSYEEELKLNAYKRLYQKFSISKDPTYISPTHRFYYRTRIQLHYDKKIKKLGFKVPYSSRIVEVQSCLLPTEKLREKLSFLYTDQNWIKLVEDQKELGHIEIDERHDSPLINKPYASLGFEQINQEMNQKVISKLEQYNHSVKPKAIIDLFGGKGNLTQNFTASTLVIDSYNYQSPIKNHQEFINLNLYGKDSLKKMKQIWKNKHCDWLILDPPRSGLKNLNEWIELIQPNFITYLSCNPHTQVRDTLGVVQNYKVEDLTFFDMFPGTHHLETMMHLSKKSL